GGVIVQKRCDREAAKMLIKKFQSYLENTLGIGIKIYSEDKKNRYPLFMEEVYDLYRCSIEGYDFIVMIDKEAQARTPATIRKHAAIVFNKTELETIYVCEAIKSFDRKRLIEQRVSFVIPENQMYLPILKIDLREHFRNLRSAKNNKLSPSTQVILLRAFYEKDMNCYTTRILSEKHNYSMMTLKRTFDELEGFGLAEVFQEGRERVLRFLYKGRELWDKSVQILRTPVKRRVFVSKTSIAKDWVKAGLYALAHHTMLAEPEEEIFAMNAEYFSELKKSGKIAQRQRMNSDCVQIEIWQYQPELLSKNGIADPLSVYLSLYNTDDERVEIALDSILENFSW
ncbi:MAG TPA: hypothetical protein PLK58_17015, partial [Candidatus Rifleibacterium sp.]|nr:hypothetical protein [Candidatus Rifleibacterium sp.]